LRDFPQEALSQCGFELRRIHEPGEFRVIYIAKHEDFIYVLHGFQKKTQATHKDDIDLAIKRNKSIGE